MKTDIQPKGILTRFCGSWTVMITAGVLLTLAGNIEAASKSGGGAATKDLPINVQFWVDDFHPSSLVNRVVADGDSYTTDQTLPASAVEPSYKHGQEYVSAQIGPDQNIIVHSTQYKKAPVRHFILNGGFPSDVPAGWASPPSGVANTSKRPVFLGTVIPISMFQIYGQNHDDTPPGFIRHVNARLVITDDAGRTWTVYYGSRPNPNGFQYAPDGSCMAVERLHNTPSGTSRWRFWTEGQLVENLHLGYLYVFEGTPVREVFAGVVDMPMSGTFESLTVEPEPSSAGYTVPEIPAECP